MNKSFILHLDSLEILNDLTDIQKGQLFNAIYQDRLGSSVELDPLLKMVFLPFKNQFKRDDEKYEKTCERNKKIAEARWNKGSKNKSTSGTSGTSGNEAIPNDTTYTYNKNKNKKDSDSKKEKLPTKKPKGFEYPELFEKLWAYYKHDNKGDKWRGYVSAKKRFSDGYVIKDFYRAIDLENIKDFGKRHFSTILNGDIDIDKNIKPIKRTKREDQLI